MRNFKDESFIGQYLSPKLIRDLRLFAIARRRARASTCASRRSTTTAGYRHVREALVAASTTWATREPDIQVWSVDLRGDRSLTLRHTQHNNRPLHDERAGGAEARRPPVGLRRQSRERRRQRRGDQRTGRCAAPDEPTAPDVAEPTEPARPIARARRSSPDS